MQRNLKGRRRHALAAKATLAVTTCVASFFAGDAYGQSRRATSETSSPSARNTDTGPGRFYIGLRGQFSFVADTKFTSLFPDRVRRAVALETNSGFAGEITAGWHIPVLPFILEVNAGYRQFEAESIIVNEFARNNEAGSVGVAHAHVFLWYKLTGLGPISISLGAGLGPALVSLDAQSIGDLRLPDQNTGVFSYQGGTTLAVRLTPRLEGTLDYRFFSTDRFTVGRTGNGSTVLQDHGIGIGIRYRL